MKERLGRHIEGLSLTNKIERISNLVITFNSGQRISIKGDELVKKYVKQIETLDLSKAKFLVLDKQLVNLNYMNSIEWFIADDKSC